MNEFAEICGTCKHHKPDLFDGEDWRCDNERSQHYCLETDYQDSCEDWEERE